MKVGELVEFLRGRPADQEIVLESTVAGAARRQIQAVRLTLVYDSKIRTTNDRRFYDVVADRFSPSGVKCVVLSGWNGGDEQEEMLQRDKTDGSMHFNPF